MKRFVFLWRLGKREAIIGLRRNTKKVELSFTGSRGGRDQR